MGDHNSEIVEVHDPIVIEIAGRACSGLKPVRTYHRNIAEIDGTVTVKVIVTVAYVILIQLCVCHISVSPLVRLKNSVIFCRRNCTIAAAHPRMEKEARRACRG